MSVFLVDVVWTAVAVDATETIAEARVIIVGVIRAAGVILTGHRQHCSLIPPRTAIFHRQRRPAVSVLCDGSLEQRSKQRQR